MRLRRMRRRALVGLNPSGPEFGRTGSAISTLFVRVGNMNKDRVRGGRRGYLDNKKEKTPY
jgi:hypothetical protein